MFTDQRFRLLMDMVPVLIWCADAVGQFVYFNKVWFDFTGRPADEELGPAWRDSLHPDDVAHAVALVDAHLLRHEPFQLEFRLRRHDGAWRHMLCAGVPHNDAATAFAGFIGSCIDLTDIKDAEAQRQRDVDEKAAMMQELHHRVKNNAQVFASLLSVQGSRASDPAVKAALRAAAARASTMAFAQQQIWDAGSSARFDLGALVRRLARAQQVRHVQVDVEAPATLFVPLATAVPLGLIAHELLTNAVAHGFPDGAPGHVRIALSRDRHANLIMIVADDGIGVPASIALELGRSAGLTIVRSLVRQLGATLAITGERGTRVTLTAPCPSPG